MSTQPLSLPALSQDVVAGVNRSVKSVNGVTPDQAGNVALPDSGTSVTLVDNGDGTATILAGTNITDNNDGSATLTVA